MLKILCCYTIMVEIKKKMWSIELVRIVNLMYIFYLR